MHIAHWKDVHNLFNNNPIYWVKKTNAKLVITISSSDGIASKPTLLLRYNATSTKLYSWLQIYSVWSFIIFSYLFVWSSAKIILWQFLNAVAYPKSHLLPVIHRNRIISRWEKWNVQVNQHNKSNISHFWVNCLGLSTKSEYSLATVSGCMDFSIL